MIMAKEPLGFAWAVGSNSSAAMGLCSRSFNEVIRPEGDCMLMVETELKPSPIHGVGVFLRQPVRKGDLIWRFDSRIDRVYTEEEVATFPEHIQQFLRIYSTWHDATKLWVLCGDHARHFNHSDNPNTVSNAISFGEDRALMDLAPGTELTSDYRTICDMVRSNGGGF
jgi:SET domain-containing protein